MNALETMQNILDLPNLINADLKYCLLNQDKVPYKTDGTNVRPNQMADFVSLDALYTEALEKYAGIGISIQASKICAIDVDHCFKSPFSIESIDDRGKEILSIFKDTAYCEFSFSGTGLRILFKHDIIDEYSSIYYVKNAKTQLEYYQPSLKSFRYVTITGKPIADNPIQLCNSKILYTFLDRYMLRPVRKKKSAAPVLADTTIEHYQEMVKYHYLVNTQFQNIWFSQAPGSGKDESERDYFLISYIYENITRDKDTIKILFEMSPFFKSKDWKHKNKWIYNDYRYYNYIYDTLI